VKRASCRAANQAFFGFLVATGLLIDAALEEDEEDLSLGHDSDSDMSENDDDAPTDPPEAQVPVVEMVSVSETLRYNIIRSDRHHHSLLPAESCSGGSGAHYHYCFIGGGV